MRHQGVCIKANVLRRRSLLAMVFFEAIKTILFCGASTIITVVLKTCVGVPLTMKVCGSTTDYESEHLIGVLIASIFFCCLHGIKNEHKLKACYFVSILIASPSCSAT